VSKRSNFERREADFYPTPKAAVLPLIPFLRASGIRTFAEPCAGEGDLVRHLESYGLRCTYQGDIRTGQDALELDHYGAADAIITNPPFTRPVMHALIEHFERIAPTWLLMESDWVSTLQAVPYLPHCSDIVTIGRVKWFADSKHSSKDNFGWFRFDAGHKGVTAIHRRGEDKAGIANLNRRTRICEQCRKPYEQWQRSSSRFCSPACKQLAYRKRLSVTTSVTPAVITGTAIEPSYEYRYVRHPDVPRFTRDGWERLPALDGTHHGQYSALMRRLVQQGDDQAQSLIG
jgi:hypothetical protein